MKNCEFPACKREATSGVYCYGHKRLMGVSGPVKVSAPVKKESEKMKDIKAILKKKYPAFLKTRPFCNIKSPVCTKIATCVNHTRGRGRDEILNEDTWEASCEHCNGYIEQHPDWNQGQHKLSRHKKSK